MSRVREFSPERKQSTLTLSQTSAFRQNSPINNYASFKPDSKKSQTPPNNSLASSRVLKRSQVSNSNSNCNSNASEYICVGCFNQKISSESKERKQLSLKKSRLD